MTHTDPAVRALVQAIDDGNRQAFTDLLADEATMSDDGSDRDLGAWIDREIFTANGRMEVVSETDGGRALIAHFTNDTWGQMRTRWRFVISDRKISRFETGRA